MSRARWGGATAQDYALTQTQIFQSTRPVRGRDNSKPASSSFCSLFQSTRPVRGRDGRKLMQAVDYRKFQSTRPVRGRDTCQCKY